MIFLTDTHPATTEAIKLASVLPCRDGLGPAAAPGNGYALAGGART